MNISVTGRSPRRQLPEWLLIVGLVLLCINPGFTQGENRLNTLLCAVMSLSPAVLLLRRARVIIPRIDIPLGLVCVFVLTWPAIFHPEHIRLSTTLFTCAYCVYIMMLARLARISGLSPEKFSRLIRYVIYSFAIVLVVQQLCVLTGSPVFNASMTYPNPWKLNSLTSEPSHSSVTLAALMFFLTQTYVRTNPGAGIWRFVKQEWPVCLCWVWVLFSTFNSSAYLLAPLPVVPFIRKGNAWKYALAAICIASAVLFTGAGDQPLIKRIKDFAIAAVSMNEEKMFEADISAADRIVPTIWGWKALRDSGPAIFTGHGTDADTHQLQSRVYDFTTKENKGFAGFFSMCYNYGLPCALAFWWATGVCTIVARRPISILTFLFALQMSADFNMQLVWMIIAFGMITKTSVFGDSRLLSTWCPREKDMDRKVKSMFQGDEKVN